MSRSATGIPAADASTGVHQPGFINREPLRCARAILASMVSRPPAGTIPDLPGSYQFKDAQGRVIYVGKARSLRSRLSNYFGAPGTLAPRTAQMVAAAESVEWISVRNDVEALLLEYSLIKAHRPRFNIRLRDDKSYPYLAVTTPVDEWPRAMVMRGTKRKGVRYLGPYGHAHAIRETLDLLLRTFPIRTCSDRKLSDHQRLGRPCLLFHIEKCSGPCVYEVSKADYDAMVTDLIEFLEGDTEPVVRRLQEQMTQASGSLDFERAARLRDRLVSVRKVIERQGMVANRPEDLDVIGLAEDHLEASVQVFFVRRGRMIGRQGFMFDKVEDLTPGALVGHILETLYAETGPASAGVPSQILVPALPEDPDVFSGWLAQLRGAAVRIRVPQRGEKKALATTVAANAAEELNRQRLRRASDHNSRARALKDLQEALGLPRAPLRIECYDMSHIQGSDYVGSMVVMEDGLLKRSDYRRFKVRHVPGNDDFAAMEEVLTRRLRHLVEPEPASTAGRTRPARFAYPPDLLLVDGGKGQLGVAVRALAEADLSSKISVASLAKRFEEVYIPGRSEPVAIARQSEALYLLQRLRDEAHRFAITYHRTLRAKRVTTSALDAVPGLGPTRTARLLGELGGLNGVRAASLDKLLSLAWLPSRVARDLYSCLHPSEAQ
ncbi:MAG: excinuclease ABC subunit UvrC [Acidimicrobiales bacterium]